MVRVISRSDPSQEKIQQTLDGIPKDLKENNPHAWQQIESRVGYEETQLRSAVKKVVSSRQSCRVSLLIACQLKKDSVLDPAKQMKLTALTRAVMARTSESDVHKFGIETFMRVALFVRPYTCSLSVGKV